MACPNQNAAPDDAPAVLWVVARREDGPGRRPLYYGGSAVGWVYSLTVAETFASWIVARALADIFPGAVACRVWIWDPLPPSADLAPLVLAG